MKLAQLLKDLASGSISGFYIEYRHRTYVYQVAERLKLKIRVSVLGSESILGASTDEIFPLVTLK